MGWDVDAGRASLFRIEVELMKENGNCHVTGAAGKTMREVIKTAFDHIKARSKELQVEKVLDEYDLHVQIVNLMQAREGGQTGMASFVAMLSALYEKPCAKGTAIIGDIGIQGTALPLENLAESVLVARENGG